MLLNFILIFVPVILGQQDALDHQRVLDTLGNYHLYWTVDDDTITFEVQVRTRGWVGLGFSSNGTMTGADMVIITMDAEGKANISDRYGVGNALPPEDRQQSYELLSAMQNVTHTTARFRRSINSCDAQDYSISNDTVRVLFAYNADYIAGAAALGVHTVRGVSSIRLLAPVDRAAVRKRFAEDDVSTYDLNVTNVPVPRDYHTLYWCQVFEILPQEKKHIIGVEMLIERGNERNVHHSLLYSCGDHDVSQFVGRPQPCFDRSEQNIYEPMKLCSTDIIAAWGVGGEATAMPDDFGTPIFGTSERRFMMLEMHYDNRDYRSNVIDSSGLRLYVTPTLRPIEVGWLTLGTPSKFLQVIPPGQKQFTTYSYCSAACTEELGEGNKINIISAIGYTHNTGKAVRVRHVRRGIELSPIYVDNTYDFNDLTPMMLSDAREVLPGDELITECDYDTSQRTEATLGGYSTENEMCFVLLQFYPRPPNVAGGNACLSFADFKTGMKLLGARDVYYVSEVDVKISDRYGRNVSVTDWITKQADWSANKAQERYANAIAYQKHWKDGTHQQICSLTSNNGSNGQAATKNTKVFFNISAPSIVSKYQAPDPCSSAPKIATNLFSLFLTSSLIVLIKL